MEKNDGTEKREQEGQPEGEGNHGAQAPQAQEEQVAAAQADAKGGAAAEGGAGADADWKRQLADRDAEIARLKETAADEKLGYELRLAGARNVKAAKALLADFKGDIAALKAAEPWMFEAAAAPKGEEPAGKTGLSSSGAATDEGATLKRWRRIAGLDDEDKSKR